VDEPIIAATLAKPVIYLAAPFALPEPEANLVRAVAIADELLTIGSVIPYVPHLTMVWEKMSQRTKADWYAYGLALLSRCDAVFRISGESFGADRDVEVARELKIPVFDDVQILIRWADGLSHPH
jgi:hypothetical protein